MRILIRDLQPGQAYAVQFKARTATQESDWSQKMTFSTNSDVLAPATVTGLSLTVQGTSFLATWSKVLTNTNGTALTDFKDYEVVVTNGATGVTYFTSSERFDFTLEMNRAAFGTPKAAITVAIRARDVFLNAVAVGASASATNPVPAAPTSFAGQPAVNSINFTWAHNVDTDLKFYRLYRGATAGTVTTLAYEGLANNYTYSTIDFGTNEFFKLATVDVFDQETFASNTVASAPLTFDETDVAPPAAPTWPGSWFTTETDLSNRNARRVDAVITWNANVEADMGSYILQYKKTTDTVWAETIVSGTATNPPANTTKVYGLAGGVIYNFRVAASDKSGNTSVFVNSPTNLSTGTDSTAPSTPSTPTVTNFIGTLLATWNGLNSSGGAMESDTERVEVHVSTSSGFTPSTATLKTYFSSAYSGRPQQAVLSGLAYGTVHYVKFIAYDFSGNPSPPSTQASGTPIRVGTAAIDDLAVTDAKIGSLNAGKITTGELAAGVRIIAGNELSTHAELTSTGLRVYAEDLVDGIPNEVIRIGTDTNDFFGIANLNGELLASIDDQGRGAFQAVDIAGYDADGDGVKDSGLLVYGRDFSDWDNEKSRGFVALGSYPGVQSFGPVVNEYGLFELSADLSIDRLYEIMAGPLVFSGSQINSALDLNIRYTTDGTAPTITSNLLQSTRWPINFAGTATPSSSGYCRASGRFATGSYRFLLTIRRAVGTGTVYANTSASQVFYFSISDMGRFAEPTLVLNTGGGSYSDGTGTAPAPSVKKTYIQTYAATWARTFKGDGTVRTDVDDDEMVQGHQSANGNQKAMIGGFLRGGGTIAPLTDITGSTISKIEVYLYANHWYANSGGTAILGAHGATSLPASFSSSGSHLVSGWPKPGGLWVTLPSSWHAAFLTGGNRGITLGPGLSTSTLYYGRFNGPGRGGSTIPLMRITYVK